MTLPRCKKPFKLQYFLDITVTEYIVIFLTCLNGNRAGENPFFVFSGFSSRLTVMILNYIALKMLKSIPTSNKNCL